MRHYIFKKRTVLFNHFLRMMNIDIELTYEGLLYIFDPRRFLLKSQPLLLLNENS